MDHRRVAIFIEGDRAATNGPRQPSHRQPNPQHQRRSDEREAQCRVPPPWGHPRRVRGHPVYLGPVGIVAVAPEPDGRGDADAAADGHANAKRDRETDPDSVLDAHDKTAAGLSASGGSDTRVAGRRRI